MKFPKVGFSSFMGYTLKWVMRSLDQEKVPYYIKSTEMGNAQHTEIIQKCLYLTNRMTFRDEFGFGNVSILSNILKKPLHWCMVPNIPFSPIPGQKKSSFLEVFPVVCWKFSFTFSETNARSALFRVVNESLPPWLLQFAEMIRAGHSFLSQAPKRTDRTHKVCALCTLCLVPSIQVFSEPAVSIL